MITRDDPRLTAYVLDELSANDRAEVEQALTDSPELRQTVDELRQTQTALVHAFEHLLPNLSEGESIELSENQRQLIASNSGATMRIEAATAPVAGRYSEWRILAVAALVLYAATMTLFVYQRDTVKTERVSQVGGRSRVLGHDLLNDFNAASNGPEVRSPTAGKGVDGEHELSLRMNRQNMNAAEPELRQSEMQLQNLSEDDVADFVNPEPVPRSVGVGAPGVTHWSAGFGGGEIYERPLWRQRFGGSAYAGGGQYGGDYAYRGANCLGF